MTDFVLQRRMMVDGQLRTYDIPDAAVLAAMGAVPRERFVADPSVAYLDRPVAMVTGHPRTMMTPMVFARLLQAAEILPGRRVLDVGCGTGYSAAVIARLTDSVVGLEVDGALAADARELLAEVGAPAVEVVTGPLTAGHPSDAPYDVIVLEGSVATEPTDLLNQLADGGSLVGVIGLGRAARAMVYRKSGTTWGGRAITEAAAPLLPGFEPAAAFVF